jgi:hypothetical protein
MTTIHQDWSDFSNALRFENTELLLIGAHALAFHVEARLTEDLDAFVEPSAENAPQRSRSTGDAARRVGTRVPLAGEAPRREPGARRRLIRSPA